MVSWVGRLTRREVLLGSLLGALGVSCSSSSSGSARRVTPPLSRARPVELWSHFDLPSEDPRSRELSAIAWDAANGVLWAVQDETPSIVGLIPDRELRSWTFGPSLTVDVGVPVDLEGIAVVPDGFLIGSEAGPHVFEIDKRGRLRRDLVIPKHFREARHNKSLESLAISPSGRYVFTTSEAALERDGSVATKSRGTRLRILRLDRQSGAIVSEHAYETDPLPYDEGEWGVSDMTALGDGELLVLERGYSKGRGNTVRIYRTALDARASCLEQAQLQAESPRLDKTLLVDLEKLDASGIAAAKQPQPTPLLDNYEGIVLGPKLPDGRSSLILVSDDNGHDLQVARLVVLAL